MRACTKICELSLFVETDIFTFVRVLLAKFNFVRFVHILEQLNSFIRSKHEFFDFKTFLDNFLHFSSNLFKFLGRERLFNVKIIIKAVVNCRTDSKFCIRIKTFYSLSKNMRSCMPESFFSVCVVKCKYFK